MWINICKISWISKLVNIERFYSNNWFLRSCSNLPIERLYAHSGKECRYLFVSYLGPFIFTYTKIKGDRINVNYEGHNHISHSNTVLEEKYKWCADVYIFLVILLIVIIFYKNSLTIVNCSNRKKNYPRLEFRNLRTGLSAYEVVFYFTKVTK